MAYRYVVKYGGHDQSGQAIKLFQASRKISFTFRFWQTSFILDGVKLAVTQQQFWMKRMRHFRGLNILWPPPTYFQASRPQNSRIYAPACLFQIFRDFPVMHLRTLLKCISIFFTEQPIECRYSCVCCWTQQNWTLTFYLHDAVYLYLRTVNQILAEGYTDYGDGHLIRNKSIGQRFAGVYSTTIIFVWFTVDELIRFSPFDRLSAHSLGNDSSYLSPW